MDRRTKKSYLSTKLRGRLDTIEGVKYLDLSGVENESIGGSKIDQLLLHSDVRNLRVEDFDGEVDVGRAAQMVTCRNLRLANCRVRTMTASKAAFRGCRFVDCTFLAIRAVGASFVGCTFEGTIRSAIFDCTHYKQLEPQGKLPFLDNDFRSCVLRDTSFRGGIDLRRQIFSDEQQRLIIPDGARLLAELRELVRKRRVSAGLKRFYEQLRRTVVDFQQEQVFVSREFLQEVRADSREQWNRCVGDCPEFRRWAVRVQDLAEA